MERAAADGATAIVTAAGDTPFLPRDLVARLAAAGPVAIAVTPGGRRHPVFGLWPVGLRDDLSAALRAGTRRVAEWAERHGAAEVGFPDEAAFFNVNSPADLARAGELADLAGRRG
jgi:molybdopterin-guanine dinucleotide biosynthesis protein A